MTSTDPGFFNTQGFMPHGMCILWRPEILWAHVISNGLITLAYFSIPITLLYVIIKRKDFHYKLVFTLFSAFIFACGTTHLMSIVTFWNPIYGWSAVFLIITAIVSIVTAFAIWFLIPSILKIPSVWQMQTLKNKYQTLLRSTSNGIFGVNTSGQVTFMNKAALNMLGFTKKEILNESFHAKAHYQHEDGSSYQEEDCPIFHSYSNRSMHTIDNEVFWHKTGKPLYVEYNVTPIYEQNNIVGAVIVFSDISERKASTEKLHEYSELLKKSNEELFDFAYIVSHDLKEPIRGLRNLTTFIIEDYKDKLDDDGKDLLKKMRTASEHMHTMIDSLLKYSRVCNLALAKQENDVNAIIKEKLEMLDSFIQEQGVTVTILKNLPSLVCDKNQIGEVFSNLIVNAAKYNDSKEKAINIDYEEKEDEFVFSVKDNGIGIKTQDQKKIFDIFRRLHDEDSYGGGTGAGLSITKKIIDRHNGTVWVESTEGKGSTFYFTISKTQPN